MTAVLLLSAGLGAVPGFVAEHARPRGAVVQVGFVPTASSIYGAPPWVEADREHLRSFGYALHEIDLTTLTGDALDAALAGVDVLYLAGGNTFHLMHHVRRSGLDRLLPAHLDRGLVYVGASAGSVVAGLDLAPLALMDDPGEAEPLATTRGLGLVDVVPVPHADGRLPPYPLSLIEEIVATFGPHHPLRLVRDDEALAVVDGAVRLVPSALEVTPGG